MEKENNNTPTKYLNQKFANKTVKQYLKQGDATSSTRRSLQ